MTAGLLFARLLLALVFGIAGISKFADPTGSKKSLVDFGVPRFLVGPLALLLPLLELSCAFGLVPASSAWWGASGVLVMLLFFIAAISLSLIRGRRPDCHCFGQLHSSPIGWKTVVRNLMLAAVAAFVLWQQAKHPGLGFVDAFGTLGPLQFGWLAFGAFAAFQLWFSFHLLPQNGRLLLRDRER